jgi:thiosulfate dehydrogenase
MARFVQFESGGRAMKRFVIGFIIGIVLLPVIALVVIFLGDAPVATAGPPLPLEKTVTSLALDKAIDKEAPKSSPVPPTEANLLAGAKTYQDYCAVCHGTASDSKTAIASGMYPPPPQLFHGKGVTDDPAGVTFWKVTNGIRLTGMPAFVGSLSDEQRWQVSELLANANKLPGSVQQLIRQPAPAH